MNILLNLSNFDEEWAKPTLEEFIKPEMRVCMFPLSYDEGWITDEEEWESHYGKEGTHYEELVSPFRAYGIDDDQINWVSYYSDDTNSCLEKMKDSDILFFTGGLPDWMLQRLYDLNIESAIRDFPGIIMGTSAGALIQLEEYHLTPDDDYKFQYQWGLGILKGFDIETHYEENRNHVKAILRSLREKGRPIIAIGNQGGAVIEGDDCELIGQAFIVGTEDIDDLEDLYQMID